MKKPFYLKPQNFIPILLYIFAFGVFVFSLTACGEMPGSSTPDIGPGESFGGSSTFYGQNLTALENEAGYTDAPFTNCLFLSGDVDRFQAACDDDIRCDVKRYDRYLIDSGYTADACYSKLWKHIYDATCGPRTISKSLWNTYEYEFTTTRTDCSERDEEK